MTEEELAKITSSIKEKLGDEGTAKIADDLGTLFTANASTLKNLQEKDDTIAKLTSDKEALVLANGNLLKQVPMGTETPREDTQKEESGVPHNFSLNSVFDERGRFKKIL